MQTRAWRALAASLLWQAAAPASASASVAAAAGGGWVLDVQDWDCGSYEISEEGVTVEACGSLCSGFAYMAHWWGGEGEGRCGCTDDCSTRGAATDASVNEHNIVFRQSARTRSRHLDTWGVFRKDWNCNSFATESTGLNLEECLNFCGDAGYSHTQHWWGGVDQGKCRCGSDCDLKTASDTDTEGNEHNAVYKPASDIEETWAYVTHTRRCDVKDSSSNKMGLESCIGHCDGFVGMYHYENSHYKCRCADECIDGKENIINENKVYRAIPLQSTWAEWKENYECKQFYNLRNYAQRKDLASCMEFCSGFSFLIYRTRGASQRCQCATSCESSTALVGRVGETTKVYKALPIQMLFATR